MAARMRGRGTSSNLEVPLKSISLTMLGLGWTVILTLTPIQLRAEENPHDNRPPAAIVRHLATTEKIAWYGTLATGLEMAESMNRPILLISGAPHCQGVPGLW